MKIFNQLLKKRILEASKISEIIRISTIYDLIYLKLFNYHLLKDKEVSKRNWEYINFLNKDYDLLRYLMIKMESEEWTNSNIQPLLNLLEENQKLEISISYNISEYLSFFDNNLSFIWDDEEELEEEILENHNEYALFYNCINANNRKIEKIKRMEM